MQEQEKVTNVHDEDASIVFKGSPASLAANDQKGKNGNGTSDNHLSNLGNGDPLGVEPLGLALDGHQKVVEIHDGVDSNCGERKERNGGCELFFRKSTILFQFFSLTVDSGVEQSRWAVGNKSVPGAEQDGNVVVPVQKHQFLLVCDNEKGINELSGFTEGEKETPHSSGRRTDGIFRIHAQIIVESVGVDIVEQGGSKTEKSNPTENGKGQIPGSQSLFHHVRLSLLHVLLPVENGQHVHHTASDGEPVVAVHPIPEVFGSPSQLPAKKSPKFQQNKRKMTLVNHNNTYAIAAPAD